MRLTLAFVLLLIGLCCAFRPIAVEHQAEASYQVVVKPVPTDDSDVDLTIEVKNDGPRPLIVNYGGVNQVFGIYVLGPWGWVDGGKRWMHQQVAQGRRIEVAPGKVWVVHCRLSEMFPANELRRGGKFQINVKFYYKDAGMSVPVDSAPAMIELPAK